MWQYKNAHTGAIGTCTEQQRVAMMADPHLAGLSYSRITPKEPAPTPVFDLPERAEPGRKKKQAIEELMADDANEPSQEA